MLFENDVKESLKAGLEGHLRYYVDTYLKDTEKDRAGYRGHIIEQEQSFLMRSPDESARLRVIEYLDSHPLAKEYAIAYVGALHRTETMPSISSGQAHGHDPLQEQLHRLEGGPLSALVQFIYNEHYHDLNVALDKAGLATTVAGMVEAHCDAQAGGVESANRFHEERVHRQEFVREAGMEEVNRTLSEIGGKSSAHNWTNTADALGNERLHQLEGTLGQAATGDVIRELHPGRVPGDSAWQDGNVRHPELFTEGAEKQEGASDNRIQHPNNSKVDLNRGSVDSKLHKPQVGHGSHPGHHAHGMSAPDHASQPVIQGPQTDTMNLPLDTGLHQGGQGDHGGMNVADRVAQDTGQVPETSTMNITLPDQDRYSGALSQDLTPPVDTDHHAKVFAGKMEPSHPSRSDRVHPSAGRDVEPANHRFFTGDEYRHIVGQERLTFVPSLGSAGIDPNHPQHDPANVLQNGNHHAGPHAIDPGILDSGHHAGPHVVDPGTLEVRSAAPLSIGSNHPGQTSGGGNHGAATTHAVAPNDPHDIAATSHVADHDAGSLDSK
jgi:hypothetical protein